MRTLGIFVACGAVAFTSACKQDNAVKEINKAPMAEIYSPDPSEEIKEGVYFLSSGRVWDTDDPFEQLSVTWILDGEPKCPESPPMADGRTECGMSIGQSDAQVSLYVQDPSGESYQASVSVVSLPATGPTITIEEPSQNSYVVGDKLAFIGTVSDGEDVPTALRVWWWSDLDDELDIDLAQDDDGSVVGYYDGLSQGTHVLRLWAEDTSGRANSSEVVINVLPEPAPPLVGISAPDDESVHDAGIVILFQASIGDEATPAADLEVQWSSSLDGVFNTDAATSLGEISFSTSSLSVGSHEITLLVTDGDGMTNSERVGITIVAPDTGG